MSEAHELQLAIMDAQRREALVKLLCFCHEKRLAVTSDMVNAARVAKAEEAVEILEGKLLEARAAYGDMLQQRQVEIERLIDPKIALV